MSSPKPRSRAPVRLSTEPNYSGRIVKMNRGLQGGGWVLVDADLPQAATPTGGRP